MRRNGPLRVTTNGWTTCEEVDQERSSHTAHARRGHQRTREGTGTRARVRRRSRRPLVKHISAQRRRRIQTTHCAHTATELAHDTRVAESTRSGKMRGGRRHRQTDGALTDAVQPANAERRARPRGVARAHGSGHTAPEQRRTDMVLTTRKDAQRVTILFKTSRTQAHRAGSEETAEGAIECLKRYE